MQLLAGLKNDPAGHVLYENIQQMLQSLLRQHSDSERAYTALLNSLLDVFLLQTESGSPVATQLEIIRQRLSPPLSIAELTAIEPLLQRAIEALPVNRDASSAVIDALQGLFISFGIKVPENNYAVVSNTTQTSKQPPDQSSVTHETPLQSTRERILSSRQHVDTAFRRYLDEKRQDLQILRESLSTKLDDAITRSSEFGQMLLKELEAIQNVERSDEIECIRESLSREISAIAIDHEILKETLANTADCIQQIGLDSEHINDELTRVHTLSLTDDLTGLPNRRALLRHLEDEISRAQRHSTALSIAMMDLDNFKNINDTYGHASGDRVLKSYAQNVLSVFRMHDMVARYGGEEFAVVLPNTDLHGAQAALQKVRNRAATLTVSFEEIMLPMPSFSAGISVYHENDSVDTLMKRSDRALYMAKNSGKNRIEILLRDNEQQTDSSVDFGEYQD